jgi:hypothetical protein
MAPAEGPSPGGTARPQSPPDTSGSLGLLDLWWPGIDVGLGMGGVAAAAGMSGETGSSLIARLGLASTGEAPGAYAMV